MSAIHLRNRRPRRIRRLTRPIDELIHISPRTKESQLRKRGLKQARRLFGRMDKRAVAMWDRDIHTPIAQLISGYLSPARKIPAAVRSRHRRDWLYSTEFHKALRLIKHHVDVGDEVVIYGHENLACRRPRRFYTSADEYTEEVGPVYARNKINTLFRGTVSDFVIYEEGDFEQDADDFNLEFDKNNTYLKDSVFETVNNKKEKLEVQLASRSHNLTLYLMNNTTPDQLEFIPNQRYWSSVDRPSDCTILNERIISSIHLIRDGRDLLRRGGSYLLNPRPRLNLRQRAARRPTKTIRRR